MCGVVDISDYLSTTLMWNISYSFWKYAERDGVKKFRDL